MAKEFDTTVPRTFFLNEQHELTRGEKETGGSLPKLAPINWQAKSRKLHGSLTAARETINRSNDPLRESRYFLAANPTPRIRKESKNQRRAKDGIIEEQTEYAGEHSRIFRRLGMDLLAVDPKGTALVHAPVARMEQLIKTSEVLSTENRREQSRWVTIDSFDTISIDFRIDMQWLSSLASGTIDSVVELQPLLSRVEVEQVVRAILDMLGARGSRERFTRMGTDFSGRHWYRGALLRDSLRSIAQYFYSVQSLHPPLQTSMALASPVNVGSRMKGQLRTSKGGEPDPLTLPRVAVVDAGVPAGHLQLGRYRLGAYMKPDGSGAQLGDHGSLVASRVVFGDPDYSAGVGPAPPAMCSFIDVNIAETPRKIDDKALLPALEAVVATYPDVRVFNLSFGDYEPLSSYSSVKRREKLLLLQDLDNFVFARDALVVIAAGNSPTGIVPNPDYPSHFDVKEWALGSWASGFNTLVCGSYVGRIAPGGLVTSEGWPSPFTRIGPGLCDSPVPSFSANGGNSAPDYQPKPGLGVWCLTAAGQWEDQPGTSFAAPLLAREAAIAVSELQRYCQMGAQPFAATVKAYLALTAAAPVDFPNHVRPLAKRTLGRGTGISERLRRPRPESAVMIWQGVLADVEDIARIEIPMPRTWLRAAKKPVLRLLCAWESPVNYAVEHIWASRKVRAQLKPRSPGRALTSRDRRNHPSFPFSDRSFDLASAPPPPVDFWILEISYEQICEYAATIEFSPHQRVGIAMELTDEAEEPQSPQSAMQALPKAATMNRLTVPENRIANPIIIRTRA